MWDTTTFTEDRGRLADGAVAGDFLGRRCRGFGRTIAQGRA
jgi:hypothetical protein